MANSHPASDKKRRRLRLAGDVAGVGDLPGASLALGAAMLFAVAAPALAESLAALARELWSRPEAPDLGLAGAAAGKALGLAAAGAAALALVGFLPAWIASGFLWATARLGKGIEPRLPAPEAKAVLPGLGAALALVLGWVLFLPATLEAARLPPLGAAERLVTTGLFAGTAVAVLSGVLSFLAARRAYEARIAMTDAEKRREVEEEEGAAEVRRYRREAIERIMGAASAGGQAPRTGTVARPGAPGGPT